jgi:hypothetical protein
MSFFKLKSNLTKILSPRPQVPARKKMWSVLDLVSGRNEPSAVYPPDNSNDIALKSYVPGYNLTSLTDDMRTALSKATFTLRTWDDETASVDVEMKGHLRALADQIDSKAHEITSNAWILLEELDVYSSTPLSAVELGEPSPLNYTYSQESHEYFNLSMVSAGIHLSVS